MLHWRGKQHRKQQSPKPFIDLNWLIPLKFANLGLMYICEKVVIFFFLRLSISLESMLLMNLSWVEKKNKHFRYLEQILPSEFGAVRSPWFLFSPSYWWSNRKDMATAQYKVQYMYHILALAKTRI